MDFSECMICCQPFQKYLPAVLRKCGHTFCVHCIRKTENRTIGFRFFCCYLCTQTTVVRVDGRKPYVLNTELKLLVDRPTRPAKCGECNEIFGSKREPFFLSIRNARNTCSHSVCRPCYDRMKADKAMFCRICVLPISVPRRNAKPVKNFSLLWEIESLIANDYQIVRIIAGEHVRINLSIIRLFKRVVRRVFVFARWFNRFLPLNIHGKLLRRMIKRLCSLLRLNRVPIQDMQVMICQFTLVNFHYFTTKQARERAVAILRNQAKIDQYLTCRLYPGVRGWPKQDDDDM